MDVSQISGNSPVPTEAIIKMVFNCDRITQDHIDETKRLFEKYFPIEMDPNIDLEEKKGHMKDWFTENMKMYAELQLTESDFEAMTLKSNMACRHGIIELFN